MDFWIVMSVDRQLIIRDRVVFHVNEDTTRTLKMFTSARSAKNSAAQNSGNLSAMAKRHMEQIYGPCPAYPGYNDPGRAQMLELRSAWQKRVRRFLEAVHCTVVPDAMPQPGKVEVED